MLAAVCVRTFYLFLLHFFCFVSLSPPTFNSLHMLELAVSLHLIRFLCSYTFSSLFSFTVRFFFLSALIRFSIHFFSLIFVFMGNIVILIIISLGLPDYLPQVRVTRTIELSWNFSFVFTYFYRSLALSLYISFRIFFVFLSSVHLFVRSFTRERVCLIVNVVKVEFLK